MFWTRACLYHNQLQLQNQRPCINLKYCYWKIAQLQNAHKIYWPTNSNLVKQRQCVYYFRTEWFSIQPPDHHLPHHSLLHTMMYWHPTTGWTYQYFFMLTLQTWENHTLWPRIHQPTFTLLYGRVVQTVGPCRIGLELIMSMALLTSQEHCNCGT